MAYATIDDVSAELGGVSITAATAITSTMVSGWIDDAEEEVELLSGQVYASTAITSSDYEYHDYNGDGVIMLNKYPVISIESIEYEKNGFGASSQEWVALVGPGTVSSTNFQLYKESGAVRLHANSTGNAPTSGHQNIRVCYTYGRTTVPSVVKQLVSKLAARRYIQAVANKNAAKSSKAVSIGAINISDPSNYVQTRLTALNADIDRLQRELVGKFRVVNHDARIYT